MIAVRNLPKPAPAPGQIRIAVRACGLNPADWAVVDGLLADQLPPLPPGINIDALGEDVTGVCDR